MLPRLQPSRVLRGCDLTHQHTLSVSGSRKQAAEVVPLIILRIPPFPGHVPSPAMVCILLRTLRLYSVFDDFSSSLYPASSLPRRQRHALLLSALSGSPARQSRTLSRGVRAVQYRDRTQSERAKLSKPTPLLFGAMHHRVGVTTAAPIPMVNVTCCRVYSSYTYN